MNGPVIKYFSFFLLFIFLIKLHTPAIYAAKLSFQKEQAQTVPVDAEVPAEESEEKSKVAWQEYFAHAVPVLLEHPTPSDQDEKPIALQFCFSVPYLPVATPPPDFYI